MKTPRYLNFWLFVAALVVVGGVVGSILGAARGVLLGFDAGALVYVATTLWRLSGSDAGDMRARAKANDPDHHVLLLVALMIVCVVLVAVWVELTGAGGSKGLSVAISGATLLIAWVFSNLLFALHYAHLFYIPGDDSDAPGRGDGEDQDSGGLDFPGDEMPDYGDFAYFSFVLGMTFQVSDVSITSKRIRRLALYHSIAAFLFDIIVVALSVSLIGDLLK